MGNEPGTFEIYGIKLRTQTVSKNSSCAGCFFDGNEMCYQDLPGIDLPSCVATGAEIIFIPADEDEKKS